MAKSLLENKHIVRLEDRKGTKGWQLRVPRWHPLYPYTQYFADAQFPSKAKALAAAKARRRELFEDEGFNHKVNRHSKKQFDQPEAVGLSFAQDLRRLPKQVWYWTAYWSEAGLQKHKAFSVSRFGFEGALAAAVQVREGITGQAIEEEPLLQSALLGYLKVRESARNAGLL